MLLFNGCRTNDETIKNERQIQGSEYSSKTLWNEDEKYIKNVIKIYNQYKETVSKSTQIKGEPFWDYAMTMGQFNESYLEVPVVNQEKVVQILRVIRKGSQVYFGSNSAEKASLDFFQQLIFGKYTKIKAEEERKGKVNSGGGATAYGEVVCTTRKISMWYPDNNNNPDGSGHWESKYETKCEWVEKEKVDTIDPCVGPECVGGGGLPEGGNPGFPYPDEANKIDIEQLKDFPCAYSLALQLTNENIGGDLARLLKDTFGANERVNISFVTSDNKFLGETVTGGFRFTGDANNFNGTVYLNKDRLSNATQDFLLSTMYHEVLHGYLNYERSRIGETEFNNRYPAMESYDVKLGDGTTMKKFLFIGTDQNHNRMGPFINGIKQAVLNFDPSYPPYRAEALAMGGIIAENSLPPGHRGISSHEADGSTAALGKRCSN
ncbi:hypothetical protein HZP39_00330 [Elizabethkingia anophelis]|nr:hypothetical protein [Elizabethkingia anophelis]AMR39900.1 hypothetical protein A2T74_00345 [Elizabethkingia anophelis]AMX46538.1 hypothetical protein A4C56_00345 [Elizabethkingia anophelis]AMX49997.1 hypothetical protein A2T72_00345 [Elizabethkingia anophelis]AMX53388.1 hypothetical protein A2T59_00345 [Elizabethkingia anophelis]EGT4347392.1 hypothetical protein [Elizabethkingia anophelis]